MARRSGIGGSDAAAILNESPYRSPYTVWAEKMSIVGSKGDFDSEAMVWGRILEAPVREEWERRTKLKATPFENALIRDEQHPFFFASPDALVGDDEGLEIKTASEWKSHDWSSQVPLSYQIQMQHYIGVTGRQRWHVAALIGGQRLVCATIERNEAFIEELRTYLAEWWKIHVEDKERPPVDGSESTTETIKEAFPKSMAEEIVQLDATYLELHEALRAAKESEKHVKARIAEIENKIKAAIGNAEVGALPNGAGAYKWATQHRAAYSVEEQDYRVLRYVKGKA